MGDKQREKAAAMTEEERKLRYGKCKGKAWSPARRAAQLTKKGKDNGTTI